MKNKFQSLLNVILASFLIMLIFSCKKQEAEAERNFDVTGVDSTMHTFNYDGNKIQIMEKNGVYYFAEDITLSKEQFNLLKVNSNKMISTSERALIINSLVKRWTNATVYYNLTGLGPDTASTFRAMEYISRVSPVRFVMRSTQSNYINFMKSTGNNSAVGMIGGAQTLNLYNYNTPGIIIHEIFHALGVMHEQCRTDQENHVIIHRENLNDNVEYNFNKVSASSYTDFGTFNYESIMMYEPYAFSINGQPTITKLDGSLYQTSYPSANMSPVDIAGINQLYSGFNYVGLAANTNYEISTALDNSKLLNVPNSATSDGTQVIIYADGNSSNARWNLTKNSDGYYKMSPLHAPGKSLTVVSSATANGTKLEIRTSTGSPAQQFNILPAGGGYYIISPRNAPAKNIDIPGSSTSNGTLLNIWGYGGAANQKFKFSTY